MILSKDIDLYMDQMTIEDFLHGFSRTQWIREEFNLVIMSALYTEHPNLIKIIKTFSLQIWMFIILKILIITTFLYIKQEIEGIRSFYSLIRL